MKQLIGSLDGTVVVTHPQKVAAVAVRKSITFCRHLHVPVLGVALDIFSRYVVGWMVPERQSAALGQKLISESYKKQGIESGNLTVHADNGSPMIAKTAAQLFVSLGINKSHSRPHVSDDNAYSESQFKTLKYCPGFPDRF